MTVDEAVQFWSEVWCGRRADWESEDYINKEQLRAIIKKVSDPLEEKIKRVEDYVIGLEKRSERAKDGFAGRIGFMQAEEIRKALEGR